MLLMNPSVKLVPSRGFRTEPGHKKDDKAKIVAYLLMTSIDPARPNLRKSLNG